LFVALSVPVAASFGKGRESGSIFFASEENNALFLFVY